MALWLSPAFGGNNGRKICYGLYEGRMLVEMTDGHGNSRFAVEDGDGHTLFYVPVRNCLLDVRFRGGRLRFREKATGRGGYVDKDGIVTFMYDDKRSDGYEQAVHESADFAKARPIVMNAKTQRVGVCNAAETLLVDEAIAKEFLPQSTGDTLIDGLTFSWPYFRSSSPLRGSATKG